MTEELDKLRAKATPADAAQPRAAAPFDIGPANGAAGAEMAATLRAAVETVRRIIGADTASVASFSVEERTITWHAMSGFEIVNTDEGEIVNPLRGEFAERAAGAGEAIFEVRGVAGDLPASEFPVHSAEGIRALALARLAARGETLGVLAVGYRAPHRFTAEEKQQLAGLAEMVALALDNARLVETIGTAKRVWEQTFDAIPDGIIVHDDRMRVARCNHGAAEMMGMRPTEAIGMSCAEAFARLFGARAAAYHMRQGTARTTSSFELQAEDGRRYLVSVAPIISLESGKKADDIADTHALNEEGPDSVAGHRTPASELQTSWSVITWSDITELSEVQEQLARTRRLATIGQLAAGVAHEINNPLAAITTCAEATLRDLQDAPEASAFAAGHNWNFYLEEIVRQALRCKQITRGLLDLSRQRRAKRASVELNRVVGQCAKLFEQRGAERGIELTIRLDEAVGEVATDEAMVYQVLNNLLSNALDAVADGGHICVETAFDGARISVEVSDDGPGIPPETLARVFDPFFTTKDPGSGSGLGLAVSLTLAEAMGGALTVESKPGVGSCFRLWLPRRTPEKQ